VRVGIDVRDDGSGLVRVAVGLDPEAAAAAPDLADRLVVDDLREKGWTITGPEPPDGTRIVWVRASKPFSRPEDAGTLVAEISGTNGPFRDFAVERDASTFSTSTRFRGVVDLAGGLEAFGDDDLRERLGGTSLGASDDELIARLRQPLARAFQFQIDVNLPGDVESNAPVQASGGARWTPTLGEEVTLTATARRTDTTRVAAGAVAVVAALLFLAIVVVRRARRRHDAPQNSSNPDKGAS
jgi:hypothetical protein